MYIPYFLPNYTEKCSLERYIQKHSIVSLNISFYKQAKQHVDMLCDTTVLLYIIDLLEKCEHGEAKLTDLDVIISHLAEERDVVRLQDGGPRARGGPRLHALLQVDDIITQSAQIPCIVRTDEHN